MAASDAPESRGRFGPFGGQYVPETLMAALAELERAYDACGHDDGFQRQLAELQHRYVGRPTPVYHARNLSVRYGAQIYFKREDLAERLSPLYQGRPVPILPLGPVIGVHVGPGAVGAITLRAE